MYATGEGRRRHGGGKGAVPSPEVENDIRDEHSSSISQVSEWTGKTV